MESHLGSTPRRASLGGAGALVEPHLVELPLVELPPVELPLVELPLVELPLVKPVGRCPSWSSVGKKQCSLDGARVGRNPRDNLSRRCWDPEEPLSGTPDSSLSGSPVWNPSSY